MRKFKNTLVLMLLAVALTGIHSCSKDSDNSNSNLGMGTISGKVVNDGGSALAGVTISVDGKTTLTGTDGKFTLTGLSKASNYKVKAEKDGFFPGYRNVEKVDGEVVQPTITLIARTLTGTLPGAGGTVNDNNGMKIISASDAFVDADGKPYSGDVRVYSKYIKADNLNLLAATMPGGDFAAVDVNGEDGVLQSFGFIATQFEDLSGNELKPKPGKVNAALTMPSGTPDPIAEGAKAWAFDPGSGRWSESGSITKQAEEIYLPVTQLIFANLDVFKSYLFIKGRIVDCDDKPLAGSEVIIDVFDGPTSGIPVARYSTHTNKNGKYFVRVIARPGGAINNYLVSAEGSSKQVLNATERNTITVEDIKPADCGGGGGGGGGGSSSFVKWGTNAPWKILYAKDSLISEGRVSYFQFTALQDIVPSQGGGPVPLFFYFRGKPSPGTYNVTTIVDSLTDLKVNQVMIDGFDPHKYDEWESTGFGTLTVAIENGKFRLIFSDIPMKKINPPVTSTTISGDIKSD